VPGPEVHILAYAGLGPGQEFIPYFLALLALLVSAFGAVVRWPFRVLARALGRLRRREGEAPAEPGTTVPESADARPRQQP
jgi:hypothetical protein